MFWCSFELSSVQLQSPPPKGNTPQRIQCLLAFIQWRRPQLIFCLSLLFQSSCAQSERDASLAVHQITNTHWPLSTWARPSRERKHRILTSVSNQSTFQGDSVVMMRKIKDLYHIIPRILCRHVLIFNYTYSIPEIAQSFAYGIKPETSTITINFTRGGWQDIKLKITLLLNKKNNIFFDKTSRCERLFYWTGKIKSDLKRGLHQDDAKILLNCPQPVNLKGHLPWWKRISGVNVATKFIANPQLSKHV